MSPKNNYMATRKGFEPLRMDRQSIMLPLHQRALLAQVGIEPTTDPAYEAGELPLLYRAMFCLWQGHDPATFRLQGECSSY